MASVSIGDGAGKGEPGVSALASRGRKPPDWLNWSRRAKEEDRMNAQRLADSVYKALLAGFCFYSCVTILSNTALQGVLYKRYENFATIWQVVELIAYLIVQFIWMRALARPLPAKHAQRPVLPASVYQRISPEIHYQLQAMNKQLMHFWKLEEPGS